MRAIGSRRSDFAAVLANSILVDKESAGIFRRNLGGDAEDKGVTAAVAIELTSSLCRRRSRANHRERQRIDPYRLGNCQHAGNKERQLISG